MWLSNNIQDNDHHQQQKTEVKTKMTAKVDKVYQILVT